MNQTIRNAVIRISVLLILICAVSFWWEASRNSSLQSLTGNVTRVRNVFSSKGGDTKEFTIRYIFKGKRYYLVTRRGIIDSIGGLRGLKRGDSVALAVDPDNPDNALLNTFNSLYAITLCFVTLSAVFFVVVIVLAIRGLLSSSKL